MIAVALPTEPELRRCGFWFLRHGETDWNAQGRSQGQVDIPLNATGLRQAAAAAAALRGQPVRRLVTSPLIRARQTAEIVADALGLGIECDPGLQEVAFGDQEGEPVGDWYDCWIAGAYTPPGAERFADLRARAVAALNRALAAPGPVLVVAHGALFRAVRSAMGMEPNIRTPNAVPLWCDPGPEGWTVTALD